MSHTAAAPAADRFGVPLKGWSLASLYPSPDEGEGTLVTVACDQCGEGFFTDSPDDDTTCAVCLMPPAEVAALRAMILAHAPARVAACAFCGDPMYGTDGDGTRHPRCARFVAELAPRYGAEMEEPIAA